MSVIEIPEEEAREKAAEIRAKTVRPANIAGAFWLSVFLAAVLGLGHWMFFAENIEDENRIIDQVIRSLKTYPDQWTYSSAGLGDGDDAVWVNKNNQIFVYFDRRDSNPDFVRIGISDPDADHQYISDYRADRTFNLSVYNDIKLRWAVGAIYNRQTSQELDLAVDSLRDAVNDNAYINLLDAEKQNATPKEFIRFKVKHRLNDRILTAHRDGDRYYLNGLDEFLIVHVDDFDKLFIRIVE